MIEGLAKAFQEVKEVPVQKNDITPSFVKDMPEPKLTLQAADGIAGTMANKLKTLDDNITFDKLDSETSAIRDEGKSFRQTKEHLDKPEADRHSDDTSEGMKKGEISKLCKNYLSDLKKISPCPDTINELTDCSDMEKRSPDETRELRSKFNGMRIKLIKEWEKLNGQEWPKYEKDVYDKNGNIVRKAGDYMEAHHIKPLSLGGQNTSENITPMHYDDHNDHRGIQSSDSSYSKLENKVRENAQ